MIRVKCPKCNTIMSELEEDCENMTDGQQADYEAGFNRPHYCSKCKEMHLISRPGEFYPDIDDEFDEMDDKIDDKVFEDLIDRAIDKRCFIEVISLVHNVIESYLKFRLRDEILKKHEISFDNFPLKDKKNIIEKLKELGVYDKIIILFGRGKSNYLKYLDDYKEMCYMFKLIDKNMFRDITKFNMQRNAAAHKLLKFQEEGSKVKHYRYRDIIATAELGREIQLKLSPLEHSEEEIKKILGRFELDPVQDSEDPFLKGCGLPYGEP